MWNCLNNCLKNKLKDRRHHTDLLLSTDKHTHVCKYGVLHFSTGVEIKKKSNSAYQYWILDLGDCSWPISLTTQSTQKLFWSIQLYHVIIGMFRQLLFPVSRINFQLRVSSRRGQKVLNKVLQKFGNLNICNSTTTEQTPPADEHHVIQSKAAEQLLKLYFHAKQRIGTGHLRNKITTLWYKVTST